MTKNRRFPFGFFLGFALVLSLVSGGALFAATQITGAGASFPYPLYTKWFSEYQKSHSDAQFNYQSIGSGGGVKQFLERTIDFGASDAPMTEEQLKKATAPVFHIPTVLGAVVVTYNVKGVQTGLKLNGEVIADIFLGKITKWNDPKLTKLNPGVTLSGDIIVVHRADGSGTTNIFTDYLSKVSPDWKQKVGTGTAVNWPSGIGGKGNEGVSGSVKQSSGSIGYVELIYAENNKLPYATVENSSKKFVVPSLKSVSASATGVKIPDDFRVSLTNSSAREAYPISGFTYLLVYQQQTNPDKGSKIVSFLKWALTDGQKYADSLFYSPLPEAVKKRALQRVSAIEIKPQG